MTWPGSSASPWATPWSWAGSPSTRSAGRCRGGADVEVAHSVPEALTLAGPAPVVFVAGGGQVYAEAMPLATDLMITEVPLEPDGDITFPPIDPALWREASREDLADRSYVDYVRGADSQAS